MNFNVKKIKFDFDDDYDEYLYKILVDYIQDKPMSYEILQEFIHERQEQWCYE